jgi:hypothetical protein
MKLIQSASILVLGSVSLVACGASRDVEVDGKVAANADIVGDDEIRVEFYEEQPAEEGEPATLALVHSSTLTDVGVFTETVAIEGEKLHVFAIVDRDGDEACTDGEPWGEANVTISEENTAEVSVNVVQKTTCPAL